MNVTFDDFIVISAKNASTWVRGGGEIGDMARSQWRNLFAPAMWKNASGSQKRKRKREKEKAVQASKCQKLDSFFICPAHGQYLMLKTTRIALSVLQEVHSIA